MANRRTSRVSFSIFARLTLPEMVLCFFASAMVSAAGFLLAVVAVALLCWQQITWLGRGGVLLLCGVGLTIGNLLGGRLADWKLLPSLMGIFAVLAGLFFCMKRFAPRLVPLLGAYGK